MKEGIIDLLKFAYADTFLFIFIRGFFAGVALSAPASLRQGYGGQAAPLPSVRHSKRGSARRDGGTQTQTCSLIA
jgi:hypothetical protein